MGEHFLMMEVQTSCRGGEMCTTQQQAVLERQALQTFVTHPYSFPSFLIHIYVA